MLIELIDNDGNETFVNPVYVIRVSNRPNVSEHMTFIDMVGIGRVTVQGTLSEIIEKLNS